MSERLRITIRIAIGIVFYGSLALICWAVAVDWRATLLTLVAAFGLLTAITVFKGVR